jgi:hypothetical protein
MISLNRHHVPSSSALLMRILERPELVSAVRELPGQVLGKLIDRIGLEDAGELVALASSAQLERMFDDDLWKAAQPGDDETFRPDRFALWLRVMQEGGEDFLIQRLCGLPGDLLTLAVHRLVLVVDMDELAAHYLGPSEELDQMERALDTALCEEWEEFRLISRDPSVWDEIWNALVSLDRDHHQRLRAILEQCCAMATEYISGQGGLFQVLTSEEMLESDMAAEREDRRAAEGYVAPADARSFLELARRGAGGEERDPITRAYFRQLEEPRAEKPSVKRRSASSQASQLAAASATNELLRLLEDAEIVGATVQQPLAALTAGSKQAQAGVRPAGKKQAGQKRMTKPARPAPLFERALTDLRERDPVLFSRRVEELGYLVNVWMAGSEHDGRRPRPMEALEAALRTCEAGLKTHLTAKQMKSAQVLAVLTKVPADTLFRQGHALSHRASAASR